MPSLEDATKLLFHFDNSWASSTRYPKALTAVNGAARQSSLVKFGTEAAQFGSRDSSYLWLPYDESWRFGVGQLGTSEWTIDLWCRLDDVNSLDHVLFAFAPLSQSMPLYCYRAGAELRLWTTPNGGTSLLIGAVAAGSWYHVAVTRDAAGYIRTFLNGVPGESYLAVGAMHAQTTRLYVGGQENATHGFGGQVDEFRLLLDLCAWTSDFSASLPTSPYESYDTLYPPQIIGVDLLPQLKAKVPEFLWSNAKGGGGASGGFFNPGFN